MTDSTTNLIWVIFFRTLQTALEAAPTFLCGLFIAGLIRGMIPPELIRQWLTRDSRIGPARAWLTGLLTPVCSFGVLPIAWELKRAGVPRANVLTYLFAAPIVNPFCLIYAFQRLEGEGPIGLAALGFLMIGSFVLLTGLGLIIGQWFPEQAITPELPKQPAEGLRRIGVVLLTAARGLNSELLIFVISGLIGAGLLAVIRGGALERAVADRSVLAPFRLTAVSIPFQAIPTRGADIACEALQGGVPLGNAFIVYLLGIGVHLGTILWVGTAYGARILLLTMSILIGGSLLIGSAVPLSLPDSTTSAIKGSHFFEIDSAGGYKVAKARALRSTVIDDTGQPQWFLIAACGAIVTLSLAGFVATCLGERGTVSHLMTSGTAVTVDQVEHPLHTKIGAPQLALAGMIVLLSGIWSGLYIYYPPPAELFDQMEAIQFDLNMTLKSDPVPRQRAVQLVSVWQRLQSKLVVADAIRRGSLRSNLRMSSTELRSRIDRLRHAIREGKPPEDLQPLSAEARVATLQCRKALD